MNLEEIANRIKCPLGYDLVNFGFVGLPVFRVTAEVLCVEQSDVSAIDEFILRAIHMNICLPQQLYEFLGLPKKVIDIRLADMSRENHIHINVTSENSEKISLSAKGQEILRNHAINRPRQHVLDFTFDGLLRLEHYYPESTLHAPKDLKHLGIPTVRGVPDSGPDIQHLDPISINKSLDLDSRTKRRTPIQVLRVLQVLRRTRLYLQAVALLYRSQISDDLYVGFAIDGRPSKEHDDAFQRQKGIEKNRLFANFEVADPLDDLMQEAETGGIAEKSAQRIKMASKNLGASLPPSGGKASKAKTLSLGGGTPKSIPADQTPASRRLHVLEHHDVMLNSIKTAQTRLLIISPWIRRDIVNDSFVGLLSDSLERGVSVFIGYGIGSDEEWKEIDSDCKRRLTRLMDKFKKFSFVRLGNTHAKILLKDSDFYVISSFNWLSFRGDPSKPFREEWGNMIGISSEVDQFFDELLPRFTSTP